MHTFTGFFALLLASAVSAYPLIANRATVCNGHAEWCDRSYGNITFIGSHNSYAVDTNLLNLARNQEVDVITQLNLGVRLLQAQSHMWEGKLHFCHTDCLLYNGGTVEDYLKNVKGWLDSNPNEVLTFVFTNPEGKSPKDVWDPAFVNSGIAPLAYIPPAKPLKQSDWPTLGQLIDSGTRVVVFLDSGANGGEVEYILPEFTMVWETPFGATDASFPCSVNRTGGTLSDADHMYMINHSLNTKLFGSDNLIVPEYFRARTTNSATSILAHSYGCTQFANGRAPNFVLLDWVNIGEVTEAANRLNWVRVE